MKRIQIATVCLIMLAGRVFAESADSVWLAYQEGLSKAGDVIMTDLRVEETAIYTYYAGLVWNTGYMGIQRGGAGYFKHVHFSVWDPPTGGFATLVWSDVDVITQRFGGEGTGWQAMWPFNWEENTTYRLCVTLTHTNSATDYTAHFFDPAKGTWKHVATFRRSDALHSFAYVASFVEDFGNTIDNRRACLFGNAWLRTFDINWVDLKTAQYASTGGSQTNKDGDLVGDMFRLETGGGTTNDTSDWAVLIRSPSPLQPANQNLTIGITNSQFVTLSWQTLPWCSYYLEWTTNLLEWPPDQRQAATSNRWVEVIGSNKANYFRTMSSE